MLYEVITLVNNAAIFEPDVPTEVDPDLWDRTMRVNVRHFFITDRPVRIGVKHSHQAFPVSYNFV